MAATQQPARRVENRESKPKRPEKREAESVSKGSGKEKWGKWSFKQAEVTEGVEVAGKRVRVTCAHDMLIQPEPRVYC